MNSLGLGAGGEVEGEGAGLVGHGVFVAVVVGFEQVVDPRVGRNRGCVGAMRVVFGWQSS